MAKYVFVIDLPNEDPSELYDAIYNSLQDDYGQYVDTELDIEMFKKYN